MKYIVVDLECTCGPGINRKDMEIIEIGAVKLDKNLKEMDFFDAFVRPVIHPKLTTYCTNLTSIKQEDVDKADYFPAVFERFLKYLGNPEEYILCSWGNFDKKMLAEECGRHRIDVPFARHINVKALFGSIRGKRMGLGRAMDAMELRFEGTRHRGIDDARMVVRVMRIMPENIFKTVGSNP